MYQYICENVKEADVFDSIYVDTSSEEISDYANSMGFQVIERKVELARNTANDNDLLLYHTQKFPNYDFYCQLFATAPYLQPSTIADSFNKIISSSEHDSCFTATENYGFFWLNKTPINYRPGILPRSQDLQSVVEESTGLYGISRESLMKYNCRIGRLPYIHLISKFEAVDINMEKDLKIAACVGKEIFEY